jgi:hypothetical protein
MPTHVNIYSTEEHFRQLFALPLQQLDALHWSPLSVIRKAARFLANKPRVKILDIGSGSGKFCLAGAFYQPMAFFDGVEQRKYLANYATAVQERLGISNVRFIHKNFTQLDFTAYDNFYFYNSFFENIEGVDKIDDTIAYTAELYTYYNRFLSKKLHELAAGTRVVTYKSLDYEIPSGYVLVDAQMDHQLKFWIKR